MSTPYDIHFFTRKRNFSWTPRSRHCHADAFVTTTYLLTPFCTEWKDIKNWVWEQRKQNEIVIESWNCMAGARCSMASASKVGPIPWKPWVVRGSLSLDPTQQFRYLIGFKIYKLELASNRSNCVTWFVWPDLCDLICVTWFCVLIIFYDI